MALRTTYENFEKEISSLRLLSLITAVWFLFSGCADVVLCCPLMAVLDFFLAAFFVYFRLRMNSMTRKAVRAFAPPILIFMNLLPLGASLLEANPFTLLLRHIVTLLGTGVYMQFRARQVFNTYLLINVLTFFGSFFLGGDFRGETMNLAICYVFILLGMYFFSAVQQQTSRKLAALSNSERQARAMAFRDPLTGLFNRRHFDEELALLAERADLTLLLIDMDDFKRVNDLYGHQGGDEALKKVAFGITRAVRKDDIPCRIGGDEFAVILPDCPEKNGRVVAQNIFRQINQATPPLSLSLGIAHGVAGSSPEEIFERADKALYVAKSMGKGRILSCGDLAEILPEGAN